MICKRCGIKSDEPLKYCPRCGAPLEKDSSPKIRRILFIAGFVFLLILVGVLQILLKPQGDESPSDSSKNPEPQSTEEKELSEAEKKELQSCLARVCNFHNKWGFIDKTGKEVIPCIYSSAKKFTENGFAAVAKEDENSNEKWSFIDRDGKEIAPFQYDLAENFSTIGMAAVAKKNSNGDLKWGYINTEGSEIIPCEYDEAKYFAENGLARVKKDSLYGAVNKNGEIVIPVQYTNFTSFGSDGLALVQNVDAEAFFIDVNGTKIGSAYDPDSYILRGPNYNGIIPAFQMLEDGTTRAGCLNDKGETIIPFEYDNALFNEITGDFIINNLMFFGKEKSESDSSVYDYNCFDLQGNKVISECYNEFNSYNPNTGWITVLTKNENGNYMFSCINSDGNSLFADKYSYIEVSLNDDWISTIQISDNNTGSKNEYFNSSGEKVWELPDNYKMGGSFTDLS